MTITTLAIGTVEPSVAAQLGGFMFVAAILFVAVVVGEIIRRAVTAPAATPAPGEIADGYGRVLIVDVRNAGEVAA